MFFFLLIIFLDFAEFLEKLDSILVFFKSTEILILVNSMIINYLNIFNINLTLTKEQLILN